MLESKKQIFCCIRKIWVVETPEECVRQMLLQQLIHTLGFPPSIIVVEKELKSLPHLAIELGEIPKRRADILCYTQHSVKGMTPLLLIECKAVSLSSKMTSQLIGYNHYLKVPFIALANHIEKKLGWYDPQTSKYTFINHFPSFIELINSINF